MFSSMYLPTKLTSKERELIERSKKKINDDQLGSDGEGSDAHTSVSPNMNSGMNIDNSTPRVLLGKIGMSKLIRYIGKFSPFLKV